MKKSKTKQSKKLAPSNGKEGTPNGFKEVYGARVEQPLSPSAAAIRSRGRSVHPPEAPRPPRQYDMGNTVYIAPGTIPFNKAESPFTNGLIVGVEWGGGNKNIGRSVWAYYVRDVAKAAGSPMYLIAEDKISDRISI